MLISEKPGKKLKETLEKGSVAYCNGLFLSARWFVLSEIAKQGTNLIILPNREAAEYCAADLYSIVEGDVIFYLPDSGKRIAKSNFKSTLSVQRTSAIGKIIDNKSNKDRLFIVTYPEALEEKIPSRNEITKSVLKLESGQEISFDEIVELLYKADFERVDFVGAPGQYAIRGSIVDIFSYSYNNPYRLSFFGDEIEDITIFDCNTQLSKETVKSVEIFPNIFESKRSLKNSNSEVDSEGDFDANSKDNFDGNSEVNFGGAFEGKTKENFEQNSYENLAENEDENLESIVNIFPEKTMVWFDSSDMYKDENFYTELTEKNNFRKIYLDLPLEQKFDDKKENIIRFDIAPQPVFNKNFELLTEDIKDKIIRSYKVYIFGEKQSQLNRLKDILIENKGIVPEFVSGKNIHNGFIDHDNRICCYTDHEIFDRFHRVKIRRTVDKSEQLTLNEISAFNIGDYIVHIDHGVGVFGGLVKMPDANGKYNEVVKLTYKDGDTVFVSVHALHKISRYRSKEGIAPKIHKLGTKTWQNLKNKAKSRVKDIAKDLIQLYAKRKSSEGFAYSGDTYLQEELESSFMYEDTPDQIKTNETIKKDMEDKCPMDRLVCGDVGFGKTEVAIRAAFKAVADNKQVAVLVPTTILALQHYKTFCSRLDQFPVNIDYVSRLRTTKELNQIKKNLESGRTDIVIGTHKILSKAYQFKDLGLLIIDEEQKFGVSAKEKLREMKVAVDTLTLTATPIPRTLQFSLLGARDLSIIGTPPPNRIPIQTEIILFNEEEIKGVINYELERGGQIFFMHNRVQELKSIHDILHRLVPDMTIAIAHGQMKPKELEDIMLGFMRGDYDMLLCTTIIENGLDVPNANTIIINQAQNIGLSDLHQLRGRVGRSNKRAFCYLIVPPLVSITDDARKRLKAIEEFSDLGSGFNIAMQDLDIRGAGNLLGAQQSGFISDIGYETYQKILSEAMDELGLETGIKTSQMEERFVSDCNIETDRAAFIPDSYINVTAEKMRIYKYLDSITKNSELKKYEKEIEDRFGKLPEEFRNLFCIVKIRNIGAKLGFEKIIIRNHFLIMFFISNPMSPYFKSKTYGNILDKIALDTGLFKLKPSGTKLKIVVRGITSVFKASEILEKLQ